MQQQAGFSTGRAEQMQFGRTYGRSSGSPVACGALQLRQSALCSRRRRRQAHPAVVRPQGGGSLRSLHSYSAQRVHQLGQGTRASGVHCWGAEAVHLDGAQCCYALLLVHSAVLGCPRQTNRCQRKPISGKTAAWQGQGRHLNLPERMTLSTRVCTRFPARKALPFNGAAMLHAHSSPPENKLS